MEFSGYNVTRTLNAGCAADATATPYDGISAVTVGPDGKVRSLLPIPPGCHDFGLAVEVGGRAMNLLRPYPGACCIHGLVKRDPADPASWNQPHTSCACGQEPVGQNPARER
jgi:hypothetical protein